MSRLLSRRVLQSWRGIDFSLDEAQKTMYDFRRNLLFLCRQIRGNFKKTLLRSGTSSEKQKEGDISDHWYQSLFAWSPWPTLTVGVSQTTLTLGLSILNCITNYIREQTQLSSWSLWPSMAPRTGQFNDLTHEHRASGYYNKSRQYRRSSILYPCGGNFRLA